MEHMIKMLKNNVYIFIFKLKVILGYFENYPILSLIS